MAKKQSLYEIGQDLLALQELMDSLEDEEGNPRDPTEEEMETMKEFFVCSSSEFEQKFDNYCRFIKNLSLEADNADSERKNYKSELDRLSKRAKAFENKAKSVKGLLQWCMDSLQTKNFKSSLFSARIQQGQISIQESTTFDIDKIPVEFQKRELDTVAIKNAIKDGLLVIHPEDKNPLNRTKVFTKDGEVIPGISWNKGEFLVIR